MIVENDNGNLLYDSAHDLCGIIIRQSQGELFAFVTCLDVREDGNYTKVDQKQYWGRYSHDESAQAIKEILHHGGKWRKFE